jgi:hypothetical protein
MNAQNSEQYTNEHLNLQVMNIFQQQLTEQKSKIDHLESTVTKLMETSLFSRVTESEGLLLQRLNNILRTAGIDHPLGLRSVKDLIMQRDGYLASIREHEAEIRSLLHKYKDQGSRTELMEDLENLLPS